MIGDELRIKQILNNLLSNSFKYTASGEIKLSVDTEQLESGLESGGERSVMLVLRVSDTGQGMTDEQIKNLFHEYSRFNTEANRKTQGTGLGMSITKNLLEKMHGGISVRSELNKGTEFTVRIPQIDTGSGIISKELAINLKDFRIPDVTQNKQRRIVRRPMPHGKVLLVDDMETNLYVAKGLLMPYGLTIETALSGFEAVEKIKSGAQYDIIFMDHMMPKMDGIESANKIRDLGYSRPVVALTANAIAGQSELFLSNGFDDFISKPIDIRLLNAVLNKFIKEKPAEMIETQKPDRIKVSVNPELAKIFIRDAERSIAEIESLRAYSDEEDMQAYIINVHAMKSALANVAENELAEFAFKLEKAGRERSLELVTAETPAFLDELRAVIKKFAPTEEFNEDEDKAFTREKLLDIKAACSEYDTRVAKAALNELKTKTHSSATQKIIDALAEHLLHSDFEEAAAVAEKAAENLN
jgi:CheY-like chemotaxis protein